MHELSIAQSLIGGVCDAAREHGLKTVTEVTIRLGRLAGVVTDALRFSWEIVAEDTICAGSRLVIEDVAVVVHCPSCQKDVTLTNPSYFHCPVCDSLAPEVISGRELLLIRISDVPV